MTERERISREALLRRAAAAAGLVYVPPVLTSAASAEVNACKGKCRSDAKCMGKGGPTCRCIIRSGKKKGKCRLFGCDMCCPDERCSPGDACDAVAFCNDSMTCACLVMVLGQPNQRDCADFPSDRCEDYPPCDKTYGTGCPPGMCCFATCCPEGVCAVPCSGAASRPAGSSTGRRLTR
jgi:hypothetical protein